jgi:transposase
VEFQPARWHAEACESGKTITRRPRQSFTPAFKAKMALAAVRGDRTLAEAGHDGEPLYRVTSSHVAVWVIRDRLIRRQL